MVTSDLLLQYIATLFNKQFSTNRQYPADVFTVRRSSDFDFDSFLL